MNPSLAGAAAGSCLSPLEAPARRCRGMHLLITLATIVTLVAGGVALLPVTARADAGGVVTATTTDRLNLRAAPALSAEILDVLPVEATVDVTGEADGGFFPVSYQGQDGFAYGAYLAGVDFAEGPVITGGQQGEVNVADGPVNFRAGPSTADTVLAVIPDGGLVALTGDSANGFVSLTYSDRSGWAHAQSVFGTAAEEPTTPAGEPVAPEPLVPTESDGDGVPVGDTVTGLASVFDGGLHLRSGPGTGYPVITTMPDGTIVELRGEGQDGYLPVNFDGTTGWAAAEFLEVAGEEPAGEPAPAEEPVPTEAPREPSSPPVDGSDGYTEDEIIQIIYDAAAEYGQNGDDMLRVARCESVLDPTAVNSSSGASGLFQFLPSTWASTPWANDDVFDPVANAQATAWMWDNGRRGEWTCQ